MAAAGLRMDRFYAGAPSCTPTRATVITGRTNDRTGAFRVGDSSNKQEKTIAQAFGQAGYATAHFGKWRLNQVHPSGDNPLPADDPHNPGELGFDYWLSHTNQFNLDPTFSENGAPKQFQGDSSEVLVAEALRYLSEQSENGKPVLAVIWYASPHRPSAAALNALANEPASLHGGPPLDTDPVHTYSVPMNVTLSVDGRVVAEARRIAALRGTSLNQLVRDYLHELTRTDDAEAVVARLDALWAEESYGSERSWTRKELHERSTLHTEDMQDGYVVETLTLRNPFHA